MNAKLILNKKVWLSVGMIIFFSTLVVTATGAFFSDQETSTGNTFTAGAIDLKIDASTHYNDMACAYDVNSDSYVWAPAGQWDYDADWHPETNGNYDPATWNQNNPAHYPQAGVECNGTWPLKDLGAIDGGGQATVDSLFTFDDVKPGDDGELTLSLHLFNNDAWVCADIVNTESLDNGSTEPELEDENPYTADEGELDDVMSFFAWEDDGDNIYETGETPFFNDPISGVDVFDGDFSIPLADATTPNGPIGANTTAYIGLAWCAGDMVVTGTDITCDGFPVDNQSQTDSVSADVVFRAVQSRHNDDFECNLPVDPQPIV